MPLLYTDHKSLDLTKKRDWLNLVMLLYISRRINVVVTNRDNWEAKRDRGFSSEKKNYYEYTCSRQFSKNPVADLRDKRLWCKIFSMAPQPPLSKSLLPGQQGVGSGTVYTGATPSPVFFSPLATFFPVGSVPSHGIFFLRSALFWGTRDHGIIFWMESKQ